MAQLKCELCGSTNLVKEDGVFVCKACGAKYSVEEAKRMMNAAEEKPVIDKVKARAQAAASKLKIDSLGDFNPAAIQVAIAGAQGVNNYACQAFRLLIDEYEKLDHPSKQRQEKLLAQAKECLALLDQAAMHDADDHVAGLLIYENCTEIEEAVKDTYYWEKDAEGEWDKERLPFNASTKLAGQKDSWSAKATAHREWLQQEWLQNHPGDVEQKLELNRQIEALEAKLEELKDEKRSHGFFDFAGKREVKDRMKPVKDELAGLRRQVSAIDDACDDEIDAMLDELGKSFTRLEF